MLEETSIFVYLSQEIYEFLSEILEMYCEYLFYKKIDEGNINTQMILDKIDKSNEEEDNKY